MSKSWAFLVLYSKRKRTKTELFLYLFYESGWACCYKLLIVCCASDGSTVARSSMRMKANMRPGGCDMDPMDGPGGGRGWRGGPAAAAIDGIIARLRYGAVTAMTS